MRDQRALPPAFIASMLLHTAAVLVGYASSKLDAAPVRIPQPDREPADVWSGTTSSLPGGGARTYPVDVEQRAGAQGTQATRPNAVQPGTGSTAPVLAPQGPADGSRARRVPAPAPTTARSAERPDGPARAAGEAAPTGSDKDGADVAPGDFGAAGATAVRSLGRAFTRAVPPACQADPAWASLRVGDAGNARFEIEIDSDGHIASWRPEGEEKPAAHLVNLMKRTIALLGGGTFAVARGGVTAGTQSLEVHAAVSDGELGLDAAGRPGAPDAKVAGPADLAWQYEDGRGRAAFRDLGGRQVEITVRVIRTQVARTRPPG